MKKNYSLRFKVTAITVGVVLAAILSAAGLCFTVLQRESDRRSVEIMRLVGEDAGEVLNKYFDGIVQSVGMTANEAIDSLDSVELAKCGAGGSVSGQTKRTAEQQARLDAYLAAHCAEVQKSFSSVAGHTHGVITYYYCINPEISENEHGFFYSRVGKAGFVEQPPLDARTLDPSDMEHYCWYYSPIERGQPSWIGPYLAHFLNEMQICSYVVPIYRAGTLIGLLGMDIPLDMLIEQIRPIQVYQTGFACLCDADGRIYYHPNIEEGILPMITVSRDLLHDEDSGEHLIRYVSDGEEQQLSFSTLRNGLKLVITAPVREINASWLRTIRIILIATALVVVAYALFLLLVMGVLTRPLQALTEASRRLADGDYDAELPYHKKDEIGELTDAFRQMRDKQKDYIEDLNQRIYTDDLTGLPNLRHFFSLAEKAQAEMLAEGREPAILYFNLIGMKHFNRQFGFEEGNRLICSVAAILERHYGRQRLCRSGQDHFAAVADEANLEEELEEIFKDCQTANGGRTLPLRVGIYPNKLEPVDISAACDRAKYACDLRRGTYTSGYSYFQKGLQQRLSNARYIANHLDQAIEEGWIRVYYQALVRAVNGRICDEEALARWMDPERGLLSPHDFIPALEDAGLIYKMDLYVLEQVLKKILGQKAQGQTVVPHSINLSRSDFDSCDIVEEIRKRVDASGLPRDMITVEITESIIGSNFDFMKEQIARFRSLGFPVWMDDFGSGYSSLNVLRSIQFDVIKFDMSFMRKLDEEEDGKIILTKLMEMATAIGVDTVCEGVESEAQVRLLQEIGCSKLQGFYFSKPIPFDGQKERFSAENRLEYENMEESAYYEAIGRVNLCDLDMIALEESSAFQHSFNTLPMCIIEILGDSCRFVRSNRSSHHFLQRYFGLDLAAMSRDFFPYSSAFMKNVVQNCCVQNTRSFYDEKLSDGSTVHAFARRVSTNPVTGSVAVAAAVLSISDPDQDTTYADISGALAADYYNIYVIDLDTGGYIEYSSQVGSEELTIERRGEDFFESARRDTLTRIYEEDREPFLKCFTKENVLREIDAQGFFTTTYRLIDTGTPMYVSMKINRMRGGNRLILGVSNIDAQMKQQDEEKKLRQERVSLGRIAALAGNYIALYIVDPVTEQFFKYSSSKEYAQLGLTEQGEAFFDQVITDGEKVLYPEDRERLLHILTKDNVLREIRQNGLFVYNYRLLIEDRYVPVSLRATLLREDGGEKILFGVNRLFTKESSTNESEKIYTHIAQALAREYTDLYYVDIDTDEFIEFQTDSNFGVLNEARRGADFFEGCKRDVRLFVHPDDQEAFVRTMDPDFLRKELAKSGEYKLIYRRIKNGSSFYVRMNISRLEDDQRLLVMAVSDIDELMKKRQAEERMMEERIVYARLHALTGNFIVVYVVDPETGRYREFSATDHYVESFAQAKEGTDFFTALRKAARVFSHPDDTNRVLSLLTQENVMAEIRHSGIFTLGYRIMIDGRPLHIQMKAAMVEEKEGPRLIVGLNDIDAQVRQEEEFERRLAKAQSEANIDSLTGVKNKHAYTVTEASMDRQIQGHCQPPFAVVVFDVNNLKAVNDTSGHQAGDHYLRESCEIICGIFKRSPVFRIGGDEFAVISQGSDYDRIEELLEKANRHNAQAMQDGGIVVACGMARYENDANVAAVFERADRKMYENKSFLKGNG